MYSLTPLDRFARWARGLLACGQQNLAENMRVLIYRTAPDLFERLDFEDDNCFLDPLLFAWFTSGGSNVPLGQLLYGSIAPGRRPACQLLQTDTRGRALLPGLGELQIETGTRDVMLHFDRARNLFSCLVRDRVVPTRWVPRLRIGGTDIEIMPDCHSLLDRFVADEAGARRMPEVDRVVAVHVTQLDQAFALLATYCPDIAADITASTRRVLLFRAKKPNSFATLSAHGAVFLNVPEDANEVFFLEDLAHQCAHVIFNALTLDKQRFLTVDPATPLGEIVHDAVESRDVYRAFHALFTYTMICRVLSTIYERKVFRGTQAHELLGRLGFTLRKFAFDLAKLDTPGLFTPRGRLCYRRFATQYAQHIARAGDLVDRLDFTGQPYNFSYARFAARNPLRP
jgi:hypothetical protein